MKVAKRRSRYPNLSMPAEIQVLVDADIEQQGYSSQPAAMAAWTQWLRRSIAFERKQSTGR